MIKLQKNIEIINMIYEIRGQQVMLDSDLAKLYQCKNGTKEINQAVKNNIEKFPERLELQKMKHVVEDIKILEFLHNKVLQCLQQY